jgi:peptidoglycan/xylan/chitin deacetylase (PgdA/CDA1 family)
MSGPGHLTPRIPILAYHAISEGSPPFCVPSARLGDHLTSLHDAGWQALTLDGVLGGHAARGWPVRSVMLTFDDGLVSFATHALPLLARFGCPATLFVVAGRLGSASNWPGWSPRAPVERLLDAGALREAASAGVDIGSHSWSHPRLSSLAPERVTREILDSRARLEDVLGRPVRSFAYPFGDAPACAARLVRDHFAAGFGIRLAYATGRSRIEVLERIDACYLRHRSSLAGLQTTATRAYVSVRGLLRDVRQATYAAPRSLQPDPVQRHP